mgnify:CR=1 FL=1
MGGSGYIRFYKDGAQVESGGSAYEVTSSPFNSDDKIKNMNFEASRSKAINKLNQFVEKNLSDYSKLRNFDFGPDKRDNVSCLSPYVTHGVLNEIEIIKKSLEKFSFSKCFRRNLRNLKKCNLYILMRNS